MTTDPQPIGSAPKDRRILVWSVGPYNEPPDWMTAIYHPHYRYWHCDPNEASEYQYEALSPTHWLPLPAPP